jgi:hypothetical protein
MNAKFLLPTLFTLLAGAMSIAPDALAQDSVMQFLRGTSTTKPYFAAFDVRPANTSPQLLESAVADAFRVHFNDISVQQHMPAYPLPNGAPRMGFSRQNSAIGMIDVPSCEGALSVIVSLDKSMVKYGEYSVLQACVFGYRHGYRVNVYALFGQKSGASSIASLSGTLGRMITNSVGLGDSSKFIVETIDDIEKRLAAITPQVARVEQFPLQADKAVAADPAGALSPQESEALQRQPDGARADAAAPSLPPEVAAQLRAATAMLQQRRGELAPAPVQQQGRTDPQVQARKDLSAMGLSYFNQEQFVEAVKRDDKVACELFLTGGAVSASKKGRDGLTPIQLAKTPELVELLKRFQ